MAYKQVSPIPVVEGGTGNTTLTDGGILLGSGTSPITATAQPTDGQLLIGSTGNDPALGSLTSPDFSLDIGYDSPNITAQINPNIRKSGGYYQNLGISYDSGTGVFSVRGADADLSASNPAFVTFQSKATPGELVTIEITANQSFIDANGASEIIGNLFGFTTGVAITVDVPFFIYAVLNDAEDNCQFMIKRAPGNISTLGASFIGTPSSPIASTNGSYFSFDNITTTDYDANPARCVGSFRMQMDASDDWTVQTLNEVYDGIGQFQTNNLFSVPLGHFGANAGTITLNNGGTAPVFSTTSTIYSLTEEGYCYYRLTLSGDGGTDGAGGVEARVVCPFPITNTATDNNFFPSAINFAGGNVQFTLCLATSQQLRFRITNAATPVTWSQFTNGTRSISATCFFNTNEKQVF